MMSKLLFVAVLATLAQAFTDFHGMNPHHKSTELPDDRVHVSHDVHHVFPEHGTFFKAKYEGVHHKKWHFVELDEHDVDFMKHVTCGATDRELFVKNPSQKLRNAVAAKNYEWTVITAHQKHHCSETAIFRGVTGSTYHPETDTLQLHTIQMRYENVFEHLDFRMETDHFEGHVDDISDNTADEEVVALPEPEAESAVEETKSHSMNLQGRRWKRFKKKFKSAVKKVVQKVKKVVKTVTEKVKQVVNTVKNVVTQTYTYGPKTIKLKTLNYNKDVSKRFSKWNFNGNVRLAASANAVPTMVFTIRVEKLKLTLAEAYFNMAYKGGIRVAFSARTSYENKQTKQISLINLQSLSFKILTIPVVISITCPINAGYDIDVDGRVNFNFLLSASGNVKMGMRYTNTRGFQVINEKQLSKTRDFSPRSYRYQVGLQSQVTATFKASVNFLGFVASSMQLSAEATLQRNSQCIMLLQMNMQPIIVAQYELKMSILGKQVLNKQFGPKTLVSWKIPVINYCVPVRRSSRSRWFRRSEREMLAQATTATGSKSETEPVNEHEVDVTKPSGMDNNSTGTTWFGYADCGSQTLSNKLTFSMQFLPGDWELDNGTLSTQIILTLNHNKSLSTTNGDYQMTNLQRTYAMNDTVSAGMTATMLIHAETEEDQYSAATNSTTDPVAIESSVSIKVDADDATKISVRAAQMFCTNDYIQLVSAEYSDDNTTFAAFHSGAGAQEETLYEKLKAYAIYVPIICVIVLAVVLIIVVCQRRKAQQAHGASWAKSQHDVEPIMGQEPATHAQADYAVNSSAAPAPTQDNRVNAL